MSSGSNETIKKMSCTSNFINGKHGDHELHSQALNAKAIDAITSNGSFNHFKVPNLLILGVSI